MVMGRGAGRGEGGQGGGTVRETETEREMERDSLFHWNYVFSDLAGTRSLFKITNQLPKLSQACIGVHLLANDLFPRLD